MNSISMSRIKKIIQTIRSRNPYPEDIFVGITEEGMRGKAARISWNNCCDELEKEFNELYNEEYKD